MFMLDLIIKTVFVAFVCLMGIVLEKEIIEKLINLIGAICLPLLGFVLPGIMLVKLFRRRNLIAVLRGFVLFVFGVVNSVFILVQEFKQGKEKKKNKN